MYRAAIARAETGFRAAAAEAAGAVFKKSVDALPLLKMAPLEVPGGISAGPADFVTGSVGLNRMQRRFAELPPEEQRGLIYGGDIGSMGGFTGLYNTW